MKSLWDITKINFIIIFIYSILPRIIYINSHMDYKELQRMMLIMIFIGVHLFIELLILVIALANKNKERAKIYFFNMIITLLIAFPTCIGISFF